MSRFLHLQDHYTLTVSLDICSWFGCGADVVTNVLGVWGCFGWFWGFLVRM